MEVTGCKFSSGGISPDFPKLCKKITVQCELKLCWFFNFFCIWEGDSYGQSARSCNQFFCSHPVPQVLNTFHTKLTESELVCPDRLVCVQHTFSPVLRYKTPHKQNLVQCIFPTYISIWFHGWYAGQQTKPDLSGLWWGIQTNHGAQLLCHLR